MRVYRLVLRDDRCGGLGFGITARDWEDAISLLKEATKVSLGGPADEAMIGSWREVRNVGELEQDHVVPNMGMMPRRGVWYPNLLDIQ
jgi:hypothetical protein